MWEISPIARRNDSWYKLLKKRDENIDQTVRWQKESFHKTFYVFVLKFELNLYIIFLDKNQK